MNKLALKNIEHNPLLQELPVTLSTAAVLISVLITAVTSNSPATESKAVEVVEGIVSTSLLKTAQNAMFDM